MTTLRRLLVAVYPIRLFLALLAVVGVTGHVRAQTATPDNKGTDFIVAFPQNAAAGGPAMLTLFLTNDAAVAVTVEISGPGLSMATRTVPALAVLGFPIPSTQQVTAVNTVSNKGIRVRVLDPATTEIAVMAVSRKGSFTDAFTAFPRDVLGTEYRVASWPGISGQATVVGTENGTSVTITTPVDTLGFSAGVPRTILLNLLETFMLQGADLTGARLTSDKPIAVLGSNQQASVVSASPDYMIEQMPPVPTWGSEFVIAPIAPRTTGDIVRVLAHESDTDVSVNGSSLTTLAAGSFIEFTVASGAGASIISSKPVLVAQYNKGPVSGDPTLTDPFMVMGVPVDQFRNRLLLVTPGTPFLTPSSNRIGIVAANGDEVGLLLDGSPLALPPGTDWISVPNSGYRYVRLTITPGAHLLEHQEPTVRFGAWVYGHALGEAYGYTAGQFVVDHNAPVIFSVPDTLTAEATGPEGAAVTWTDDPAAADFGRGEIPVTCTAASGDVFQLGTTAVACSATDPAGNTTTEGFDVTVADTTPPALEVPAGITRRATSPGGAVVTYVTGASDLVDTSVDVACSRPSGSTFPLGPGQLTLVTTVSCTAMDDSGNATTKAFTVTVTNTAPSCSAVPSMPLIWPANHALVPVGILGVTDPDGDGTTIRINSIFQDEPTDDAGDGNTPVDGFGVGTSLALVRAERSGRGNGRVYHIGFTATDGLGAECSGNVTVSVPHNQRSGSIDDGALYDSTHPLQAGTPGILRSR